MRVAETDPQRCSGLTKLKGLSVAFLDGTYSKSVYRSKKSPGDELAGCRNYTEVCRAGRAQLYTQLKPRDLDPLPQPLRHDGRFQRSPDVYD